MKIDLDKIQGLALTVIQDTATRMRLPTPSLNSSTCVPKQVLLSAATKRIYCGAW